MYRLKEFLDSLEHYELLQLKQGLDRGSLNMGKAIQEKISEHEKKHAKFCVTCSNSLDPCNTSNYTLLFGPEDFKKKASFCGIDCLGYFLVKLKEIKRGEQHADKAQ